MTDQSVADAKKKNEETTDKPTRKGQARLPGMTPKRVAALEDKGEEVLEHQTDRMEAQQKEIKARDELKTLMKAEGLKQYDLDDNYEIILEKEVTEETAYVRKKKKAKAKKSKKAAD